jgi:hypothetical protein
MVEMSMDIVEAYSEYAHNWVYLTIRTSRNLATRNIIENFDSCEIVWSFVDIAGILKGVVGIHE